MMSCLSKLKVTPSFCFAFKIPEDVTASNDYLLFTEKEAAVCSVGCLSFVWWKKNQNRVNVILRDSLFWNISNNFSAQTKNIKLILVFIGIIVCNSTYGTLIHCKANCEVLWFSLYLNWSLIFLQFFFTKQTLCTSTAVHMVH